MTFRSCVGSVPVDLVDMSGVGMGAAEASVIASAGCAVPVAMARNRSTTSAMWLFVIGRVFPFP